MGLFSRKRKVIIDTNFLLLPGSKGLDIFTEIPRIIHESLELCVLESTLKELQRIIDGKTQAKGKDKFNAKLGFVMVKQKALKTLKGSSQTQHVDDEIVSLVKENVYVATLDKGLQRRVHEKGGKIITVRQNRLVLQE